MEKPPGGIFDSGTMKAGGRRPTLLVECVTDEEDR
jgi:hypothetical protein